MFIAPIATILGLVLVLLVLVWAGQRRLMYFPLGNVPSPSEVGLPDAETVSFRTEDGLALQGWWVSAALRPTGVTVIVFNGNAGNRAARSSLAAALAARGIACLLFDYRGFGNNPGSPSEAGLALDARAARAYAASRDDVDPDRLVYFGESLGAAVAVRLATHVPPRGLILRSPFSSMVDIGRHHYPYLPVRWLVRDRYPSLELIEHVDCPLLVIAGARDGIVPAAHSERLYAAARQPKRYVLIEGTGHNHHELLAGRRMLWAIDEFLAEIYLEGA